ncbi:hypothetical protein Gasu2_32470 [Galdieria sulphuraria]|uniref:Uncharacterized protein n=1 Tax=Galdieria sulphuraria TaxID=130081 RepID=M2XKB0_GALSU|nr:uncharacterized protein Gasu_20390 [Galdieria sulphuraria]EME30577.1 hypothetical protein Gasu_20390 [Galdieria sulphuraria]GJD08972.1 hypothetical protein Gasu2_32470 [Galdieria sulphuraria]|eukprot:XP_005707097.1 hypothetical protein Gasu_20390 [Galdieria sulphuraria]
MLVTNHAASKVKEFLARQKGLELREKSEQRQNVVCDHLLESLGRVDGTQVHKRRGLGSFSNNAATSSNSFDLKVQLALRKRIQKSRRESTSKNSSLLKEEDVTSEEESKTKFQKTRRHKKIFQEKVRELALRNISTPVSPKTGDSLSSIELPDQQEQEVQRELSNLEWKNPGRPVQKSEGQETLSLPEMKPNRSKRTRQKNQHKSRKVNVQKGKPKSKIQTT